MGHVVGHYKTRELFLATQFCPVAIYWFVITWGIINSGINGGKERKGWSRNAGWDHGTGEQNDAPTKGARVTGSQAMRSVCDLIRVVGPESPHFSEASQNDAQCSPPSHPTGLFFFVPGPTTLLLLVRWIGCFLLLLFFSTFFSTLL
jgi:hypothetical protein